MIVSIHQPDYIPYIGYFYKISKADIFVFLDDVQFSNDNMHHWNRIKTPQGELRLKIPVEYNFGDLINQVRTRDELKWKEKHLKTLEMNYGRAKHFKEIFPEFKALILKEYENLAALNMAVNSFICGGFNINPKFMISSTLDISTSKEERVIDICCMLKADKYISGNGARAYQIPEHFESQGISLEYTDYKSIEYPQLWREFIPSLSVLDYIFNCGFDWDYIKRSIKGT